MLDIMVWFNGERVEITGVIPIHVGMVATTQSQKKESPSLNREGVRG